MSWFFILIAYGSGSIPYGLILARVFGGIDVRQIGSGNIGTTNVLRTGRKDIAAATLACDALKGFLPAYFARKAGMEGAALFGVAYGAILGHVFPCWLKFRGGKGVATALGVFWALSAPLGIFTTLTWLFVSRLSKVSSLSALTAFTLSPLFAAFALPSSLALFSLGITLLILGTHRSNIQRLLRGEETKINKTQEEKES